MRGHPLQTTLLTHLDHSHFCPKRGVPQTLIVICCQFVNISKGNNTIDIVFFSFLYVLSLPMTKFDNFGSQPFCPKRGVPQTSIVICCQFVNISKGNNTIDIAFFSLLYVLHYDRNVRSAEQDNRVADFDNFCDE